MNVMQEISSYLVNFNLNLAGETSAQISKVKSAFNGENAIGKFEAFRYPSFYLLNEYAEINDVKVIISSKILDNRKAVVMKAEDAIKVIKLDETKCLVTSSNRSMVFEISNGDITILLDVSRTASSGAMYKISKMLKEKGLIILSSYDAVENRNYEYLYDFNVGKKLSSGFDSIDEVDGKLKVSYGIADGYLDLEGNFVMEVSDDEVEEKPKSLFDKIFDSIRVLPFLKEN